MRLVVVCALRTLVLRFCYEYFLACLFASRSISCGDAVFDVIFIIFDFSHDI